MAGWKGGFSAEEHNLAPTILSESPEAGAAPLALNPVLPVQPRPPAEVRPPMGHLAETGLVPHSQHASHDRVSPSPSLILKPSFHFLGALQCAGFHTQLVQAQDCDEVGEASMWPAAWGSPLWGRGGDMTQTGPTELKVTAPWTSHTADQGQVPRPCPGVTLGGSPSLSSTRLNQPV